MNLILENIKRDIDQQFETIKFEVSEEFGYFGPGIDLVFQIHIMKSPFFMDGDFKRIDLSDETLSDETKEFLQALDQAIKKSGHWWGKWSKRTGKLTDQAFQYEIHVGKYRNPARKNSKDKPHVYGKKRVRKKKE